MATLNIGGQKIKVGDEFLRMTPEQQSAAVEEIAASIGGGAPTPGNAPSTAAYDEALAAASQASKFGGGPVTPRGETAVGRPDILGATAATLGGLVNGIPVIGPGIQNFSDALVGAGSQLTGGNYEDTVRGLKERRAQLAAANPIARIAGEVGGSIAGVGGIAAIPGGASALGLTGSTGAKIAKGALSSAALEAADASTRGGDVAQAGLIGGAIGGGIPIIGGALNAAGRVIGERFGPIVRGALNPADEASRRVGVAAGRDRATGQGMTAIDETIAAQAGIPVSNVDRGGEVTRALGRSVANQNPEARAALTSLAEDRYKGQSGRAVDFINRLTGGKVDDLAYQERLMNQARLQNNRNYKAAENSPRAQAIFTVETQELMQSPAVQRAIDMAESRGKDYAAIAGNMPVVNPFRKGSDGKWRVVQKADGTFTAPSLRFWDQVKRNIDGMIGVAQRSGDNTEVMVLKQIKDKLVSSLDNAVPEYATARAGASAAFGADNAIDAGRVFARQPGQIPEATRAFSRMTPAEKESFSVGYASELIDRIKVRGDSQNVIRAAFENPAAREMNELVFGKAKAAQLEAYVRVEALADKLRNSLGNSTTARQLVELGIGGGGGLALTGGDWKGALTGAALVRGGRYAGEKVDAQVMERVAKLLTSGTRADLDRAVANAAMSPKWMTALTQLTNALAAPTRGAALGFGSMQVAQNNQ